MSEATKASLLILVTTILKIVGGALAAHGVVAIAGVPFDQASWLNLAESIVGLIVAGLAFWQSLKQHASTVNTGIATARVAVATARNIPISAVSDGDVHEAAIYVANKDKNGGVPAHAP